MMKNKELIEKMKVGSIVTNSQILSALKRRGLIFGYNYGYLENAQLCYSSSYGSDWKMKYLFPKGNAPKVYSVECGTLEKIYEMYGDETIEYMGCKFGIKYLDGCFNAYLQLVEKNGETEKQVNPRISLYGVII